jgi:hypothetical protein
MKVVGQAAAAFFSTAAEAQPPRVAQRTARVFFVSVASTAVNAAANRFWGPARR